MANFGSKKACIFDLDGTLLDTEPLYTQAGQEIITPYGKTFDPALKRRTMGGDARVSAAIIIEHLELPLTVDEFLGRRRVVLERLFPGAPEIAGAGDFLRHLAAGAMRIGLATSTHRELCALKLRNRSWADGFHAVVCGDDPRLSRPKPDPQIFLLCAQDLGVLPSDCLVFEDSPIGVRAATAAGMTVVAIASPYVERGELTQAALVLDDFTTAAAALGL